MNALEHALRLIGPNFVQVGFIVPDVEEAIARFTGWGPWSIYDIPGKRPPHVMEVGGVEMDFAMKIAMSDGNPHYELIQPMDDASPYADWLAAGRSGIHHLGYQVDSVPEVIEAMSAAGIRTLLTGSRVGPDGSGAYAYFDTSATLGYILEALPRNVNSWPADDTRP